MGEVKEDVIAASHQKSESSTSVAIPSDALPGGVCCDSASPKSQDSCSVSSNESVSSSPSALNAGSPVVSDQSPPGDPLSSVQLSSSEGAMQEEQMDAVEALAQCYLAQEQVFGPMSPIEYGLTQSDPLPWLFLGGIGNAANRAALESAGVTRILNVSPAPNFFTDVFSYLQIPVLDTTEENIEQYFELASSYIQETLMKNERIFVHCIAGVSRSPTMILAWYIKYPKFSLADAFKHIQMKRPIICPNAGFLKQLERWEMKCRGSSSLSAVPIQHDCMDHCAASCSFL